jgi:hypothetical protein
MRDIEDARPGFLAVEQGDDGIEPRVLDQARASGWSS